VWAPIFLFLAPCHQSFLQSNKRRAYFKKETPPSGDVTEWDFRWKDRRFAMAVFFDQ
jgi:hypothetical protein